MHQQPRSIRESARLVALIRQQIGWQIDDLNVLVTDRGLILRGHACTAVARALADIEAARLFGLPVVENRIELRTQTARDRGRVTEQSMSKVNSDDLQFPRDQVVDDDGVVGGIVGS